jgi:hypothetical protein
VTTRDKYASRFGEAEAVAIEAAAAEHARPDEIVDMLDVLGSLAVSDTAPGDYKSNRGSDPFKWALMMTISYECVSKESYREHHGIEAPWADIREWIIAEADMRSFDGVWDPMAKANGMFDFIFEPVH